MKNAEIQLIDSVTDEFSPEQIREYVEMYGEDEEPTFAPEHDKIIVVAALLGDKTAMALCHMV